MKKRYLIAGIFTGLIIQATHLIWLGSHGDKHFDLLVLLIILICSFLLSLNLTTYMADFKEIKNNSRIEIVFLAIFFILVIIPVLNINKANKSKNENRILATYKPLIENNRINTTYGKDFENFFNDRFNCRHTIISNYHFIKAVFSIQHYETDTLIYSKKHNLLALKCFQPTNINFSQEDIYEITKNINQLNKFCNSNNIKLYIIIVPYNINIYQNLIMPFDDEEGLTKLNQNINTLISSTDVNIIYPFNELKEGSKTDWVYFKTDHHWTDTGAFIGYNCLMNKIFNDFPNIKPVKKSDFYIAYNNLIRANYSRTFSCGHQLKKAGNFLKPIKKHILTTEYKFFNYKKQNKLRILQIYDSHEKTTITYNPSGDNKKVLLIGNSMIYNLYPFISATFKYSKLTNLNGIKNKKESEHYKIMKYFKNDILGYSPDILVLCISPDGLYKLKKIFDEE